MTPPSPDDDLIRRNQRTGLMVLLVVVGMVGMAFASVPLYRLFCQVTGLGGQAQKAAAPSPSDVRDRTITVHFNTDIHPDLDWVFKADQPRAAVKVGQQALVSFTAHNEGRAATAGTAVFNVSPPKAGVYFHKTQCFCFDYQLIGPGQDAHFPVMFYVDPKIMDDPNLDDVTDITLSYSFFKAESAALEQAMEAFYNSGDQNKPGAKAVPRD